jgi:hypothetical protein
MFLEMVDTEGHASLIFILRWDPATASHKNLSQ